MDCQWIPHENKYKCQNCGFVVPHDRFHRNCPTFKTETPKKPPNILQKAVNFTKAAVNHITTGMQHCTEEEKTERFNICKSNKCKLFVQHDDGGVCAHDDCGCFIRSNGKFMDKLSWAESKCPVGLWGPITKSSENSKIGV